jgi:hypothetical protein
MMAETSAGLAEAPQQPTIVPMENIASKVTNAFVVFVL